MLLSLAGIGFSYNSYPVLENISFELGKGLILGILGVNGAGKSTLLKCINKVLTPTNGSVFVDGENILNMKGSEIAKHIAYTPQKTPDACLTVFDMVLLGRKPHIKWNATHKDFHIVENILVSMNLIPFALRPIDSLSGGEMQKVIIARALAQEPKILLLDEPTGSLDIKNQFEVMSMIVDVVKKQNLSAVISIHDLNLAFRFADYLLMLKDHRIYQLTDRNNVNPSMIREVYDIDVHLAEVEGHKVVVPCCCRGVNTPA